MEPKVITLIEPITIGDEKIVQLIIEPPRAKHLRELPVGHLTMDALLNIAGACSGMPPSSMDQLMAGDAMRVAEAMGNFLAGGPGETPSP